jgi:hypothetical protein
MKKILLLSIISVFLLSSCATILTSKKQNVSFRTNNSDSEVIVDNEKIGKGEIVKNKIKRTGIKQVIVKTDNYKDEYFSLMPYKRPATFGLFMFLNISNFFLFSGLDLYSDIPYSYPNNFNVFPKHKLPSKSDNQKYIVLSPLDMKHFTMHNNYLYSIVDYSLNQPEAAYERSETETRKKIKEKEEYKEKQRHKKIEKMIILNILLKV